jgi:hypothetical protein
LATFAALVVLAACTAGGGANSPSGGPSASSGDGSGEPGASGNAALPASITDPIVADAAARLRVDAPAVTIVDARTQTFSDGSLGCPEPGMMYTQALVDGYQVIVEANDTRLDYRGSAPGRFRICENP